MNSDEIKYTRILNILRKSKPVFHSADDIEDKVMKRIMRKEEKQEPSPGILNFLFGWVYIGWVRRGLVAASIILVIAFVYQQTVILKRINNLNRQAVFIESQIITGSSDNSDAAFLYRLAGRKLPAGKINISEKQVKRLMKSYSELEAKYKDLIKLIEEDPHLRKYVEEKLDESSKKKFNM